jgi:hemolysin activation/secretion protein
MKKYIFVFLFAVSSFANIGQAFALTPEQEADILQRQIIQRQEQERQHIENRQTIKEAEKTRKSREKEGLVKEIGGIKKKGTPVEKGKRKRKRKEIYRFDKIVLKGNKVYSYKKLKKEILNEYIKKPINKENITKLQDQLTNYYICNGYVMARVYFDQNSMRREKNEETGETETVFVIVIEEGKINKLLLEEVKKKSKNDIEKENKREGKIKGFRKKLQLFFAFPFQWKGKTFNMKDFEQGIDQMNRLQSNRVSLDIKPSLQADIKDTGYSDIVIINNQDIDKAGLLGWMKTTFANVSYNNSGTKSTGENVLNINISQDNLLSINDNIYISYSESADSLFFASGNKEKEGVSYGPAHNYKTLDLFNNDEGKLRFNKSLYTSLTFPFGNYTIGANLNYSSYKTTVEGNNASFHITGETLSGNYSIERILYKTKTYRLNLESNVEMRNAESYVRDEKSRTGSRISSNMSLSLNNVIYTKLGTIIFKPSYQRGLDWFGSKRDEEVYGAGGLFKEDPRLQYNLMKAYLYFNTRINMALPLKSKVLKEDGSYAKDEKGKELKVRKKIPLIYTLTLDSQYSFNALYSINQFSIGGEHTIRGFKESGISGDNGFYARNDVKVRLIELVPEKVKKREKVMEILGKMYFSIFYDYGYVEAKYGTEIDKEFNSRDGYMEGCGLKLIYYGDYISWSLTYGRGMGSPDYLRDRDNIEKEKENIYFSITASL